MKFDDLLLLNNVKLSESQRKAVFTDKAAVVSAGAGSGKTTVLSYRFARLVLENKAHVDEILTLTFTNKAASEMYERIFSLLSKAYSEDERLKDEIKRFSKASISTLDSFSNEIARTDSARYGISRDFEILSDDEEDELIEKIVDEMYEDEKELMLIFSSLFNPVDIASKLFKSIASNVNIMTDYSAKRASSDYSSFLTSIEKIVYPRLSAMLESALALYDSSMDGAQVYDEDDPHSFKRALNLLEMGLYEDLPDYKMNRDGFARKALSPVKELFKGKWGPLASTLKAVKENRENESDAIYAVFEKFIHRLQSEKRKMGALNFADIQSLALEILKNNRRVRSFYKKKFKFIMIDEFQDNSKEQRDLLYILSEREDIDGTGIPDVDNLDRTKLFFVGDDKQSIYFFRGADVSVFNTLKDEIESIGGCLIDMKENFRSEPDLIAHYNDVFSRLMVKTEDDEISSLIEDIVKRSRNYESLYGATVARGEKVKSKIIHAQSDILAGVREEFTGSEITSSESEAEFIARYITDSVEKGTFDIPNKDGSIRKADYSDFAILFRTQKSQMPIEKVFRREMIPYTVVSSNSITIEALTSDMLAYITLLLIPEDKISYLTLLRSPFVRLSDDALMSLSDVFDHPMLLAEPFTHTSADFSAKDKKKMEDARAFYLKMRALSGRVSADMILTYLYFESGYSSYIESKLSLSSYREHYEYLYEAAKEQESLFDFLTYLRGIVGSGKRSDTELLRIKSEGVKLLNVHKSKGLEFPIVILAGANTAITYKNDKPIFSLPSDDLIAMDLSEGKKINELKHLSDKKRQIAETKRLLYVALTRAKCHLVVVASGKRIGSDSFESIYSPLLDEEEMLVFKTLTEEEVESKWEDMNTFDEFYERDALERGEYVSQKGGVKEFSHKNDESYDVRNDEKMLDDFPLSIDSILDKYNLYSDYGTLLHNTIDAYFKKEEKPSYLNGNLTDEELRRLNESASKVLERFIASDFYNSFVENKEVLSEERFYFLQDGLLLEGSMDLLILGKDYNLVIDYKSDRTENPDFHKAQLTSYIKASENLYNGKKCYGAVLYLREMKMGPIWDEDGRSTELSQL